MIKINSRFLTCTAILALTITGCSTSPKAETKTEENTNSNSSAIAETTETTDNSFCPVMESRNWNAWIDRVAEKEPRLNIAGEVDLPTPGYQVEWQPGILDRRNPPSQRISISLIPPEAVTIQVITPTKVSFTMPSPILKYHSVAIYCGGELLAEIPSVTPSE